MNEEKDFIYDEDEVVRFIQNYLPQEMKGRFSDDDLIYLIDLISDYYESKGFFDGADDEIVEIDEDELIRYVIENAERDDVCKLTAEEVILIVKGELAYCESIHLFE
ncbi:MAG: hypothetical protein LBB90_04520 [Tannerella sp.]|jgi:hypothetical protein|nr:hypothetical protein [Tannerella sp.]